jgi:hypothetical protein
VQIAQVHEQPQQYRESVVRWGGNIVSTRNERDHTVLEIIGRDLMMKAVRAMKIAVWAVFSRRFRASSIRRSTKRNAK